jgi:hypothetical protein
MSAFAAAVGALFADPNMGRDAVYIADGGAPILVAAVRSRGVPQYDVAKAAANAHPSEEQRLGRRLRIR